MLVTAWNCQKLRFNLISVGPHWPTTVLDIQRPQQTLALVSCAYPQRVDAMSTLHGQRVVVPWLQSACDLRSTSMLSRRMQPRRRLLTHSRSSWYRAMSRSYLAASRGRHQKPLWFCRTTLFERELTKSRLPPRRRSVYLLEASQFF